MDRRHLLTILLASIVGAAFAQERVADTRFTPGRGFYDAPISITIATDTPGATIRYTTDGSRPSETYGRIYGGPIPTTRTLVLRAVAYKSGLAPSNVDTHTYIYLDQVIRQPYSIPGWPNNTYRDVIKPALLAIPTMSLVMSYADFWASYDGDDIIKPVSVEIIDPRDPTRNEHADGGLESHSHKRLKRSLRLHFASEFGDARFHSNLHTGAALHDLSAVDEFDHLVLRAGNNRSWARIWNEGRACYTRDEWYRNSQIALSGIGSHGAFVHLYVNGLYWGLYNPIERPDAWFMSAHFGGNKEDWFSVSHGGTHGGDPARWNYLKGALKDKDMTVAANYRELGEYLDLENFCDYLLLTWMTGMSDWPVNNWWVGNCNNPPGPARYVGWDCEWSWDTTGGSNPGAWVYPDFRRSRSGGATLSALWHSARRSDDFLMLFADRVYRAGFNGGALTDDHSRRRWQYLNGWVRDAVVGESARWGDAMEANGHPTRTRDGDWAREIARVEGLMNGNAARFLAALRAEAFYPGINPPTFHLAGQEVRAQRLRIVAGSKVFLFNPNAAQGSILYTTDGGDPRQPGGAVDLNAIDGGNGTTITLSGTTVLKARRRILDTWSALHETTFLVPEDLGPLRLTEIMYHPAPQLMAGGLGVTRITGDLGADDAGRARLDCAGGVPAILTGGDKVVIRGSSQPANNGAFTLDRVVTVNEIRQNAVILTQPLVSEDPSLAVADVLYSGDRFEFVELKNASTTRTLNLTGVSFTEGIEYTFPDGATLAPGAFYVIAAGRADFVRRYPGVAPRGEFLGGLSNDGESVELGFTTGEEYAILGVAGDVGGRGRITFAALPANLAAGDRVRVSYAPHVLNNGACRIESISGNDVYVTERLYDSGVGGSGVFHEVLARVKYDDQSPWSPGADGLGYSLVPKERGGADSNSPAAWRSSAFVNGSPGADDPINTAVAPGRWHPVP
jgi:hypothetical protein